MQITRQTNLVLRLLMYCAAREGTVRLSDVTSFYSLSETFMQKVLQTARKNGFVETTRGRHGGIVLARAPADITVGEVVRAVEDRFEMAECFGATTTCPLERTCGLNGVFHEALDAFLSTLDRHTIADITNKRGNINVLATLDAFTREPLPKQESSPPH